MAIAAQTDQPLNADLLLEQEQARSAKYRRLAIGSTIFASISIVLALASASLYILGQRSSARAIAEATAATEKARSVTDASEHRSQEVAKDLTDRLELARRSLPIIAIGPNAAISRQGWIVQDGQPIRRVTEGIAAFAKYSPDGDAFVVAEGSRIYMSNSAASNAEVYSARTSILSAAYMPDGHNLIVTDNGGEVTILDGLTGRATKTFKTGTPGITNANVSKDGKILATASQDHKVRIWGLPTPVLLKSVEVNRDVRAVAFGDNDTKLLVSLINGISYLIEIATGRIQNVFSGPASP
jgi:WD40 repeat protein